MWLHGIDSKQILVSKLDLCRRLKCIAWILRCPVILETFTDLWFEIPGRQPPKEWEKRATRLPLLQTLFSVGRLNHQRPPDVNLWACSGANLQSTSICVLCGSQGQVEGKTLPLRLFHRGHSDNISGATDRVEIPSTCWECLRRHYSKVIGHKFIEKPVCPIPKCRSGLPTWIVELIVQQPNRREFVSLLDFLSDHV